MYEDYIQSMFGNWQTQNYQDTYDFNNIGGNPYNYMNNYGYNSFNRNISVTADIDLEELYPEIYKIVYPMVKKACDRVSSPITREVFENMVDEIYSNIEVSDTIDLHINVSNDIKNVNSINNRGGLKKEEETRETRQSSLAKDLIQILLIRELLRRRRPCFRPSCRPGPGMPPPNPRPPYSRYGY